MKEYDIQLVHSMIKNECTIDRIQFKEEATDKHLIVTNPNYGYLREEKIKVHFRNETDVALHIVWGKDTLFIPYSNIKCLIMKEI